TPFPIDLTFRHTDDFGGDTVTASTTLTVIDAPPTLRVEGDPTATEGQPYTLLLDAPDDAGDDVVTRCRIAWGDGQTDTAFFDHGVARRTFPQVDAAGHVVPDADGIAIMVPRDLDSSAYPLQVPHTYAFTENGYAITAQATDADGSYDAPPLP